MEKLTGYRELTALEIEIINKSKELAEECGMFLAALQANPSFDQRWLSIAKTHLQEGFMAVTRAIAKPTTF